MSQLTGPTQTAGQNLFTTSSTQMHVLGERMVTPDGRVFRYCKAGGTTLVPGKLQQASAEDTTNMQNLTTATVAVGDLSVTTTTTVTLSANQVAGGYLVFTQGTGGKGATYRIKSHPAASAAVVTFTLEDAVHTAVTGTPKVDVIPNPYDGVIVNPTTASSCPVGVAIYPITNAQYGWLQTHGPVACLLDDQTGVVGTQLSASNQAAGAFEPFTGVQATIGYCVTGVATTDYGMVFLTID